MKRFVISYSLRDRHLALIRHFMMAEEGESLSHVWRNFCDDHIPSRFSDPCIINVMEIEDDLEWEKWQSCCDKHHN